MKNKLRQINGWNYLWLIPLLLILSPIIIIAIPFSFGRDKIRQKEARTYWKQNTGKTLFFYSNKKGWADFVKNNILPVLNKDVIVYNLNVDKQNPSETIYNIVDLTNATFDDTRLPFIIKLNEKQPLIYSFRKDFLDIKNKSAKRDETIQKLIVEKLENKLTATNPT